jgi:uncharacterized protein (DUF2062 family)
MAPRRLRDALRSLVHLDDPPWRIALALAVGVFISFTPTYGFQTLLALGVATVFHLNRAVTVTGAWLNLPWFAPFVYAAGLRVGSALLPGLPSGLPAMSAALVLGTTILGIAAAGATYAIALGIIRRRRARAALSVHNSRRHAA